MPVRKTSCLRNAPRHIDVILYSGFDIGAELSCDPTKTPEPLRRFWNTPELRARAEQLAVNHGLTAADCWGREVFGD